MEYVTPRNVSCSKNVQITIFYSTITSKAFCFHSPLAFGTPYCKSCSLRKTNLKNVRTNWNLSSLKTMSQKNTRTIHLIKKKLPAPVETISPTTVTSWSWPVLLLTRWLHHQSVALDLLVIHLLYSRLCVIVVLEFLNQNFLTMNEYGPLYWMHIILPNSLNQLFRSSFVTFLPYPFT